MSGNPDVVSRKPGYDTAFILLSKHLKLNRICVGLETINTKSLPAFLHPFFLGTFVIFKW